jgi:hypothetical protein
MGSPRKCWFTKRTKLQYICMSYLYEMRLSQEVLEMPYLSVNTQLNTTSHVSEGGCQKQASTSHLYSRLSETRAAASRLCNRLFPSLLSYLIFSCCQLPLCELPKHTTAFRYRYDLQMYCTFVLFVNQHFLGLPASGTHCITLILTLLSIFSSLPSSYCPLLLSNIFLIQL